jgi:Zn-dependent peptidase ImmA (M78 family)
VTVATRYTDPRAHELRDSYLAIYGGQEIPVAVESIAEDLLGLRIEEADLGDWSGMLIPAKRLILVNASEAMSGDTPTRRHRFTIAHELGHWICHANGVEEAPTYCRSQDVAQDTDRDLEREANVFGAELLMPEAAVREAWGVLGPEASATSTRENVVRDVAGSFDVSTSAMWYRLYSFALVTSKPDAREVG